MNDTRSDTSKVALITGANRGIGLETARELGERGIRLVLGSRDRAKGEAAAALLRAKGMTAEAIGLDVTRSADHAAAHAHIAARYGRLDILINNAGILRPDPSSLLAPAELREVFDTNFFAVVELTRVLMPLLLKAPAARIVNVSSIVGSLTLHTDPTSRIYKDKKFSYDASKTALNAYTVHLAHELRDTPIKVNSADPGWVKTEMGGPHAIMELSEGGKTTARLATLPADGPTGGFFRLEEAFPW